MVGIGDGVLDIRWNNSLGEVTDAFTLEPGASEIFVVRFNALTTESTDVELRVRALIQIDGSSVDAESSSIEIDVLGEAKPPQGIELLGIEIGKQTTLQLIAAGYVLFALALLVLRFRHHVLLQLNPRRKRKKRRKNEAICSRSKRMSNGYKPTYILSFL